MYLEQYRFAFDPRGFRAAQYAAVDAPGRAAGAGVARAGHIALAEADRAARLDNPDWQILLKLKADGINTLFPDLQAMRALARALPVRFRRRRRRPGSTTRCRTAKTMFAMARHMGEHPTLIGQLVAIAIRQSGHQSAGRDARAAALPESRLGLPDLPDPFISIKTGMDGERLVIWSCSAT